MLESWDTEVYQSEEGKKEPQVPPGDVDNDKDSNAEEPDQPSPGLLRTWKKGQKPETCDGGEGPEPVLCLTVPGAWAAGHGFKGLLA